MQSIYEFVRRAMNEYYDQRVGIVRGCEFSQQETLRTIELYHVSKFLTTKEDSLGREKPFYNI